MANAFGDYASGFASIPESILSYLGGTDSDEIASDAVEYAKESGSAMVSQFKEDPMGFLLDMAPVVGEIRAYMDAEDLREQANAAFESGNRALGEELQQQASIAMTGAIPLVGMVGRAGKKLMMHKGRMTNDGKPIQPSDTVQGNIAVPDKDLLLAKRLIDSGYLAVENAGNPSQVKRAMTQYKKNMAGSKTFREREAAAASNDFQTIFTPDDIGDRMILGPEDLIGRVVIPVKGDMSNLGILDQIGGIPVGSQVQAGNKFSQANKDTGTGWMSQLGTAQTFQEKVKEVKRLTGQNPLAVYTSMGPDSVNFSTAIADPMIRQLQEFKPAKSDIKAFDKFMREKGASSSGPIKDFVGLESDYLADQILGRGDFENVGKRRTQFSEAMGMAQFRNRGFPNYRELVNATTDPDIYGAPTRSTGISIYEALPGDATLNPGRHMSYTGEMPGQYYGGLGGSVPFEVMFPEAFAQESARQVFDKRVGGMRPLNYVEAANSVADSKQIYETITPEKAKAIFDYLGRGQ